MDSSIGIGRGRGAGILGSNLWISIAKISIDAAFKRKAGNASRENQTVCAALGALILADADKVTTSAPTKGFCDSKIGWNHSEG